MTGVGAPSVRSSGGRGRGLLEMTGLALRHPSAWAIALAGFLARGGILLFVLPVVVLPTPTGLATLFGPDIIALAIAAPTPGVVQLVAVAVLLVVGWLVLASVVGGAADVGLAEWAAAASSLGDTGSGPRPPRRGLVARAAVARLACHLPLVIVGVWAAVRIVDAVYREYISPGDLGVSLPLRVVRDIPDAILVLVVAWLVGETIGGLAVRAVVLEGRPVGPAIGRAVASLVLHPASAAIGLVATVLGLLLPVLPLLGAALAWGQVRLDLLGSTDPVTVLLGALAFATLWIGGLAVAAVAATIRSTTWTWYALRARAAAPIAIGAPVGTPGSSVVEA